MLELLLRKKIYIEILMKVIIHLTNNIFFLKMHKLIRRVFFFTLVFIILLFNYRTQQYKKYI